MKFKEVKESFQRHRQAGQSEGAKFNPKESFTIPGMSVTTPEPVLGGVWVVVGGEEPLQGPSFPLQE